MGCGSATPQQIINNDQLGQRVDTNDEWIKSRTGIRERRIIGENESLIDLATAAAMSAGLALIRAARMSTKNTKSLRDVARETSTKLEGMMSDLKT